ncbi:MAG: efflux transporter periplasmic adaptor subunit [Nevskia sp.]|nr:efflux transporter periplasmic adaptor subunit [Nevskia sp.]
MSEHSPYISKNGSPSKVGRYALIALIIAVLLGIWGVFSRVHSRAALGKETAASSVPTVVTVKPSRSPVGEDLVLPGSVQSFNEAAIYARTSGYLKTWYTDIGAPVKKGQLLAEIDSPEVDQQLSQAQADLATAKANYELSQSTNERWKGLLATDSVSKQDADEKAGDAAAKKAALDSSGANLARLRDLESFKRVVAPFDGTVTARNTDIGALINAGQASGAQLFRVADTHKLRIYVQVPQPYAAATAPGLAAELRFAEHPGKGYPAPIVRTANAIDPATRTLQVELQVDNDKGELFPGAYAEVHFKLPADAKILRLPANTVLFRTAGLQVATVGTDGNVSLKNVTQGRDFGSTIEIINGIDANDNVVLNPPDSLADGTQVRIATPPPEAPAAGQPGQQQDKGKPS